jgi:hypothetical protein
MNNLHLFLEGALAAGYLMASLFFLRFWSSARDRLFFCFAAAFFILAVMRIALSVLAVPNENRHWLYLARLLAYTLIVWGIIAKNLSPANASKHEAAGSTGKST